MIRLFQALILLLSLLALSCEKDQLMVEYVVSGKASSAYIITFVSDSAGKTSVLFDAPLPWNYAFIADRGDTVYIGAWSSDSIKVQIFVDGDLKAEDWGDNTAEARCVVE
uniref:Uncharacterized protein n=1 Tax=candidate division WOR-3 bacterium TaxID=2052148 RepID=A0A7V3ZYX3_UNCW3